MAEATGLVMGAVALASLFQTCVDLCERFEVSKNYASDYKLCCSKIGLLKLRLSQWGRSLNIEQPGFEHPSLRALWSEQQNVVAQGLFGMQEIFEKVLSLETKYKLTDQYALSFRPSVNSCPPIPRAQPPTFAATPVRRWNSFRRRVSWAVGGKDKFNGFVDDLSFLMEQLESIAGKVADKPNTESNMSATRKHQSSQASRGPEDSKTKPGDEKEGRHGLAEILKHLNLGEVVKNLDGNVITGTQNVDGPGFIGSVGGSNGAVQRHLILVDQNAQKFGAIGTVSETVATSLCKSSDEES